MYVNVKTIFFNNDGLQIKKIKPVFNFIKGNKTKICTSKAERIARWKDSGTARSDEICDQGFHFKCSAEHAKVVRLGLTLQSSFFLYFFEQPTTKMELLRFLVCVCRDLFFCFSHSYVVLR